MRFTYKHITLDGTETTTYTVGKNNKVTTKVKFEHNKFAEFDKWFAKFEKKWVTEQENKFYQTMSKKTKEVIEHSVMYVGFLAMIGSILYNFIAAI